MTHIADKLLQDLAKKSFNDCDILAEYLIRFSNVKIVELMRKKEQDDYFKRSVGFTFLSQCEAQFRSSIEFAEFLINQSPEDKKDAVRVIKEQIESYITLMRLSSYRQFPKEEIGIGVINKNGIAKYKLT